MNLYAYVGNDPVDRGDPTGLCATDKNGNITGCEVKIDTGNLKGDDKKQFEKQANALVKQVAKAGKAAQEKGNDSQKEAWASVKTIVVDQQSVTNSRGQEVAGSFDAKTDTVTYNRGASRPVGDRTVFQAIQSVYALHEIFHAEKWNRDLATYMFGIEDSIRQSKYRGALEGATESEAETAVSTWGLARGVDFTSPYLKK